MNSTRRSSAASSNFAEDRDTSFLLKRFHAFKASRPTWTRFNSNPWILKINNIFTSSYVNVLLIFVPLGILAYQLGWGAKAIFLLNFLAIIPLAALMGYATEEISSHVGETVGGLLNATFGNAVELIVAIVALARGEIRIVQTSMLGSILSNTLLVLGCSFIAGGYNRIQQTFNATVAQTMSSLMALAVTSLLIPAAFNSSFPHPSEPGQNTNQAVLNVSHGTSIILLIIYIFYLFFQLKTHAQYFESMSEEPNDIENSPQIISNGNETTPLLAGGSDVEVQEESTLSTWEALGLLGLITIVVSYCADYLVDSIDEIVTETGISKTFIGVVLIPIVGNAAEHVTAIVVATKDKMDLAVGVAIGSSMQIALFLTPFCVIVGWIIDQPMSLLFTTFETCVLFVSVLMLNYIVQDGESNWLEGTMLFGTYMVIAIAFWNYP
ncbi:uncharacterized protein SAPINGB_P003729 [Magnusiomyces paraingens]|uniref:Vacuolar calcium ion transporter n=1 Tax=Magnusiomyces paraingens TaxID=2606893 RepID=A0A5E8BW89_9ASCO|nr:uncharacterized protein SAPINGB_P003729 [Saprochaete ingens]VVT53747.1 unnamed protein product [Saprochaete ingens]